MRTVSALRMFFALIFPFLPAMLSPYRTAGLITRCNKVPSASYTELILFAISGGAICSV